MNNPNEFVTPSTNPIENPSPIPLMNDPEALKGRYSNTVSFNVLDDVAVLDFYAVAAPFGKMQQVLVQRMFIPITMALQLPELIKKTFDQVQQNKLQSPPKSSL